MSLKKHPLMPRRKFLHTIGAFCLGAVSGLGAIAVAPREAEALPRVPPVPRIPVYRPPRIPARPPRPAPVAVRPRTVPVVKQRINSAMKALTVTDSTARRQLRNNLSTGVKKKKLGHSWQAHHVIYWDFRSHPTMAKAARGGFNMNDIGNGIRIPRTTHQNVHSALNDPKNRSTIQTLLEDMHTKHAYYTPEQTATVVRNHVRMWKYDIIGKDPLMQTFNFESGF